MAMICTCQKDKYYLMGLSNITIRRTDLIN